ncbi:right-handed parallel beta-helix repeat-containing protein [Archangium violaceum]|uniref:Ig-like domain-containing protein n=1 Tax=Archangium violaceum TaxID=83451 RepID=UPI00193C34E8|nr:Ig-like domain-containing protein [Archangium violaceum]QRK06838.1 right-handed parallel beta-helix repeat-containing protein [Archangium violaceum]
MKAHLVLRLVLPLSALGVLGACGPQLGPDDADGTAGPESTLSLALTSVTLTSPPANARVQGTVTLQARAEGPIQNIEFFRGTPPGTFIGRATLLNGVGTYHWNTDGLPRGAIDVFAKAWDAPAGQPANEWRSASVRINLVDDTGWSPLSVMTVVDPMNHGAAGNGTTDDLNALKAAVNALPTKGGIVYLPPGRSFRKTNLLVVTKSHVKFWAPNRQADINATVSGTPRRQSILCRNNTGCGFFGLKFRSDAAARFSALEDHQISIDHGSDVEVVGVEVTNSAATGVFLYGSQRSYIEGNYIHHTWADHIHHTDGASQSWVWDNFIFNEAPSKGDDGVACVTYGPDSPRCGDMEWWNNTLLGSGGGRGYAVIGGNDIDIHHNWGIGVAGAGVIVASEFGRNGEYNTASSQNITIHDNWITRSAHSIGHPGILVSGKNPNAEPLTHLRLTNNVSANNVSGQNYRAEGSYTDVVSTGLSQDVNALPSPMPTLASVKLRDTSILKTRDVSFVASTYQRGLYRIHVRRNPSGSGFQQRFEYVVKGSASDVQSFLSARQAAGDTVVGSRLVGTTSYAVLLSPSPQTVPSALSGVSFQTLRAGDNDGSLSWLWALLM